jgi:myo-inositol-1(or 4)-monophosphatase
MTNPYLEVAMEAAREAGGILLAEYARPVKITYKGDVDIVTQADRRSEDAVVTRLRMHFPKHTVVAEEGTGHEHLNGSSAARFRWYVDPLDGTTNFAHGYPCFAVSIALAEAAADGSDAEALLAGVVFNPVSGEMFTAARGEGAYLNQKRIGVSQVQRLGESLLGTGFPTHKRTSSPNIQYYWQFTLASHGVRRDGSAALDLCMVACGRFDGFWEFGLKPWDTAAGVLVLQEAGGQVSDLEGRPYRPGGPTILASNGRIHEEMRELAASIHRQATPAAK